MTIVDEVVIRLKPYLKENGYSEEEDEEQTRLTTKYFKENEWNSSL
jgi:hypothetical protein